MFEFLPVHPLNHDKKSLGRDVVETVRRRDTYQLTRVRIEVTKEDADFRIEDIP